MRFITCGTGVLALALVHVAPLAAQGKTFEGTVTFQTTDEGEVGNFTYSMKGSRARFEPQDLSMPMYMLLDMEKEVMHMVVPSEKMYMEMPIDEESLQDDDAKVPEPVNTGRKDVVAGKSCEIWTMDDPEERATYEMCLARDMGMFMQGKNPMGGGRGGSAAWQAELRKGGLTDPDARLARKGPGKETKLPAARSGDVRRRVEADPGGNEDRSEEARRLTVHAAGGHEEDEYALRGLGVRG